MKLMDGQTTTGAGASLQNHGATRSFQAVLTGTAAPSAPSTFANVSGLKFVF